MGLRIFYIICGVLSLGNAIYMLFDPGHWFFNIPADVPETGDLNAHFVRDIGLVYLISGLGFLWSARNLAQCRIVHLGNTIFISGHAALHLLDVFVGRLPLDHLLDDALPVTLPGIIMVVLYVPSVWKKVNPEAPR